MRTRSRNRRPPTGRASSLSCSGRSPARTWVSVWARCCLSWSSSAASALASASRRVAVSRWCCWRASARRLRAVAKRLRTRLMVFSRARRTGFTTCASGSSGSRSWLGRESRLNCSRIYLKKFSCDQRENMAPATWTKGICGWVVITGIWRPLARRRRIWRTVSPLRRTIGCSARSTVVALVPAGPWIGTSRVRKSSCGQSSPLKFLCQVMQAMPRRARRLNRSGLQPSRSNTRVSAGTPASGLVRSGAASGTTPRCCRCGTTSCSMALISFGSSALCRHSRGVPPSALTQ